MQNPRTITPLHAGGLSAIGCGLLLATCFLTAGWTDASTDGADVSVAVIGLLLGTLLGSIAGISLWATLTRRDLHPLIRAFAFSFFSFTASTLVFLLYQLFLTSATTSSSQGIAQGPDRFSCYVTVVLPASFGCGAVMGLLYGLLRQRQLRRTQHAHRSQEDDVEPRTARNPYAAPREQR